ncbi:ATP-binding protein [Streptomyces sp. NBC_00322]|uniref:ATP-binding protein n=1 Tax=Streptomyces sp. NBC_00322 TaxID=2975712 RepID=UPI002E288A22|nr:ATP-binding protein [Streptomyces sp. NBC_00322]
MEPRGVSGRLPAAGGRRPRPHGAEGRIRAARFPSRKSLEDFDFDHQRSVKREVISHLGTLDFVVGKENVIFLVPSVINGFRF